MDKILYRDKEDFYKEYLTQEFDVGNPLQQKHRTYCGVCNIEHEHIADPDRLQKNQLIKYLDEIHRGINLTNELLQRNQKNIIDGMKQMNENIAILAEPAKKMKDLKS